MQSGVSASYFAEKKRADDKQRAADIKAQAALEAAYAAKARVYIIDDTIDDESDSQEVTGKEGKTEESTDTNNDKVEESTTVSHSKTEESFHISDSKTEETLTISDNKKDKNQTNVLRFFAVGCHGTGDEAQAAVAELLEHLATDPNRTPAFILLLGDHYRSGMSSPQDPLFQKLFYDMYLKYPHLKKIVFVHILGNHDENIQHFPDPLCDTGIKQGMNQVAHFWSYGDTKVLQEQLASGKINLQQPPENFPPRFLPSRYFSLLHKGSETQLFCVDSNTYVDDYLNYLDYKDYVACINHLNGSSVAPARKSLAQAFINNIKKQKGITDSKQLAQLLTQEYKDRKIINEQGTIDPENQALWLETETRIAKENGRKTILAGHHPHNTPSKREYGTDSKLYLSIESRNRFAHYFGRISGGTSYNSLYRECFKKQNLVYDLSLAAHDHFFSVYNNKDDDTADYKTCQVTAGIGGGSFQKRESFDYQKHTGCFVKRLGCVEVICDKAIKAIRVLTHTVKKLKTVNKRTQFELDLLEFTNKNCHPIRTYPDDMAKEEREKIESLCTIVKQSIDDYFAFMAKKQKGSSGGFLGLLPVHKTEEGININLSHGPKGIDRVHDLWTYISASKVDDFETTVKKVYALSLRDKNKHAPKEHSFITILDKNIEKSKAYPAKDMKTLNAFVNPNAAVDSNTPIVKMAIDYSSAYSAIDLNYRP